MQQNNNFNKPAILTDVSVSSGDTSLSKTDSPTVTATHTSSGDSVGLLSKEKSAHGALIKDGGGEKNFLNSRMTHQAPKGECGGAQANLADNIDFFNNPIFSIPNPYDFVTVRPSDKNFKLSGFPSTNIMFNLLMRIAKSYSSSSEAASLGENS